MKAARLARCMERCKPDTLTMESKLPPLYSAQGGLKQILEMVRKRPARPAAPPAATARVAAEAVAAKDAQTAVTTLDKETPVAQAALASESRTI